jgi:hypothetical protein
MFFSYLNHVGDGKKLILSGDGEGGVMKILLVTKASGENFSLEAGLADGVRNFDHHRELSANPAPCRDERIPVIVGDECVEITHIDADTYVGLLRMAGRPIPEIDLLLMEQIDLNGSSACSDRFDPTLLYMVGIGELARGLKFPRPSAEGSIDVSELVEVMFVKTTEEIVELGRNATERSEATYAGCRKAISLSGRVGFWAIGPTDPLDPSRPYDDGVEAVIVYRQYYQSVSIYCSPFSPLQFGGEMVAGIIFAGHPKAAGSPRGTAMTEEDAQRVFAEIANMVG